MPAATGGPDAGQAEVELEELGDAEGELGKTGAKLAGGGAAFAAEVVKLPIDPVIADEPGFAAAKPELGGSLALAGGVFVVSAEDVEGWIVGTAEDCAGAGETAAGVAAGSLDTAGADSTSATGLETATEDEAAADGLLVDFTALALPLSCLSAAKVSVLSTALRIGRVAGSLSA